MKDKNTCEHRKAYHFHENAPPYCPECGSYPKNITENRPKIKTITEFDIDGKQQEYVLLSYHKKEIENLEEGPEILKILLRYSSKRMLVHSNMDREIKEKIKQVLK